MLGKNQNKNKADNLKDNLEINLRASLHSLPRIFLGSISKKEIEMLIS